MTFEQEQRELEADAERIEIMRWRQKRFVELATGQDDDALRETIEALLSSEDTSPSLYRLLVDVTLDREQKRELWRLG